MPRDIRPVGGQWARRVTTTANVPVPIVNAANATPKPIEPDNRDATAPTKRRDEIRKATICRAIPGFDINKTVLQQFRLRMLPTQHQRNPNQLLFLEGRRSR